MKILFTILIAFALASCSTTQAPVAPEPTEPVAVEIISPITVSVDEQPQTPTRLDPVPIVEALVDSGCKVAKFEYKEVVRGAGISVTCASKIPAATRPDPLATDGLEGL